MLLTAASYAFYEYMYFMYQAMQCSYMYSMYCGIVAGWQVESEMKGVETSALKFAEPRRQKGYELKESRYAILNYS